MRENPCACDQACSGQGVVSLESTAQRRPGRSWPPGILSSTNQNSYTVKRLNYQLKQLCRHNRDGSFVTRNSRESVLTLIANELHDLGYRHMNVRSLKPKHIEALVKAWQARALSAQTIKSRMSVLRWWAEKVDRASVVARSNDFYGIERRRMVSNVSKAKELTQEQLDQIGDAHLRISLELQRAFGLRREESLKFQPAYADQGDHIRLKGSWTKGGRPRVIPVRNEAQRELLERARRLAGLGSMIPPARRFHQQVWTYENQTSRAGLTKLHGLRHRYAQERYQELTGWPAPVAGGPRSRALSPEQKAIDRRARLTISAELGHARESVTAIYCGR